jgi:radical SAM superfamily enzyme YgiQ (UPF0313 family)
MKILLGDGPIPMGKSSDNDASPNIGVLSLIAYAREQIPDLDIHYFRPGYPDIKTFVSMLEEKTPDIYGMSFATPVAAHALEGARRLKERLPNCILIGGGAHPTIEPELTMRSAPFDFLVEGEGEITFAELVKVLQEDGDPKSVRGIWFRDGDDIHHTGKREFLENIDILPWPAWDLIDFNDYTGTVLLKAKPAAYVLASRGCPFRCVFCSNPVWHEKDNRRVRARNPQKMAEEIEYLYGRGVRDIYIRSDEFNFSLPWAKDVCRAIIALGHDDLFFQINLRADRCDEEFADLLARMGCWLVHLGVESANQRVLNGIKKGIHVEQIEECCKLVKAAGVKVYAFLMMYQVWEDKEGNLQAETPEEVANTLRFTRRMFRKGLFDYMSWQMTTPVAGSELYDIVRRHGLVPADFNPENMWDILMEIPGVSRKDMVRDRRRGMLLQAWHAFRKGNINFSSWPRMLKKLHYIVLGR